MDVLTSEKRRAPFGAMLNNVCCQLNHVYIQSHILKSVMMVQSMKNCKDQSAQQPWFVQNITDWLTPSVSGVQCLRSGVLGVLSVKGGEVGTVSAAAVTFHPAGRLQLPLLPRIKLLIHKVFSNWQPPFNWQSGLI